MIFPSESQWRDWGLEDETQKLFLLLWVELFDGSTLDTWRVRSSNVRTVLQEIVHTTKVAEDHPAFGYNVDFLVAEADSIAALDPVIIHHYPLLRNYLTSLTSPDTAGDVRQKPAAEGAADTRPRDDAVHKKKQTAARTRASVLLGHLSTYRENLIADLRAALAAPAAGKERVVRLALALATELSSLGYSSEYLRGATSVLQDSSRDFLARFDEMLRRFSGEPVAFRCTFNVFGPAVLTRLNRDEVQITKGKPPRPYSDVQEDFYSRASPHDLFATVNVKALDPVSASRAAQERLANAFAALVAYEHDKHFGVKGPLVLVTAEAIPEQVVSTESRSRARTTSTSGAAERAAELLALQQDMSEVDVEQLNAALQYHRLALAAETDEVRLVNLWIALEGLVRRSTGGGIIDRVCTLIPPAIALNNANKLVTGLAIYIREYWKAHGFSQFLAVFPSAVSSRLRPSELLEVLQDAPEGPRINELYRLVDHPLIRYRIHRLRKKTFASPKGAATNLFYHRRNVEWQIRRIYRARNEVIHRATCPPGTSLLLEHLHTYFVGTVQSVVQSVRSTRNYWSVPDALEHNRLLFDEYLRYLNSERGTHLSRAALLDPTRVLGSQEAPTAWEHSSAAQRPSETSAAGSTAIAQSPGTNSSA